MPTVSKAARVTVRTGAVWRTCGGCGVLTALPPEHDRCSTCVRRDDMHEPTRLFADGDLETVFAAGDQFAVVVADLADRQIGFGVCWDRRSTDVAVELVRLRQALSRMQAAIVAAHADLAAVEERARRRAQAAGRERPL